MSLRPLSSAPLLAAALALSACGTSAAEQEKEPEAKPELGLFTSLPIYWGEGGMSDILDGNQRPDWVRGVLEEDFTLDPLDTVEADALAGLRLLVMAQPRPLAPSENVALDSWVRGGGKLLMFADPMLTRHTDYALGDKRRHQDMVLLSPLLGHWGLELRFDEDQPLGERKVSAGKISVPVNLAGRFVETGDGEGGCRVIGQGILARCRVGKGEAMLVADAAVLDWEGAEPVPEVRREALESLLDFLRDS